MSQRLALSVDFGQGISNAWSSVVNIVPKIFAFAVILLVGWFVARVLARALDHLLRRVGFERMAEKGGMSRALKDSKYDTTAIICKVVYYAILLMTLQMGFGVFGSNPVSDMLHSIVAWLPRGIVACVIVVVAMAVANVVRDMVQGVLGGMSYGKMLGTIAWAFIVAIGAFAALGQAGIATAVTGPLLTAILATIAGIAIVGVGGGLITPMRSRWEKWLDVAERETARVRAEVATSGGTGTAMGTGMAGDASAYQKGREDAMGGQPAETPTTTHGRETGTTS
jgi:hypothetical protein